MNHRVRFVSIVSLVLFVGGVALAETPKWKSKELAEHKGNSFISITTSDAPAQFALNSAAGLLLLSEGKSVALDRATGAVRWQRDDGLSSSLLPIDGTPYAMLSKKSSLTCVDLESGTKLWKVSKKSPVGGVKKVYSYLTLGELGVVLLFGSNSPQYGATVVAAELASGRVLWTNENEIIQGRRVGGDYRLLQPPLFDGTGLVLFLEGSGPLKVNLSTGQVLWRAVEPTKPVFGSGIVPGSFGPPDWRAGGQPPMYIEGDRLVVTTGGRITVLALASGKKLWSQSLGNSGKMSFGSKPAESPIRGLASTEHGLIAWGYESTDGRDSAPWVIALDADSGEISSKKKKLLKESGSLFKQVKERSYLIDVIGDHLYAVDGKRIERIDLSTWKRNEYAEFENSSDFFSMESLSNGLFLRSSEVVALVGAGGNVVFEKKFKAPKRSLVHIAMQGALDIGLAKGLQSAGKASYAKQANSKNFLRKRAQYEQFKKENLKDLDDRLDASSRETFEESAASLDSVFFLAKGKKNPKIIQVNKGDGAVVKEIELEKKGIDVNFIVDAHGKSLYLQESTGISGYAL